MLGLAGGREGGNELNDVLVVNRHFVSRFAAIMYDGLAPSVADCELTGMQPAAAILLLDLAADADRSSPTDFGSSIYNAEAAEWT